MTYYQTQQPYQAPYAPFSGSAASIFTPGFAGTNAQEVRQLNAGYTQQPMQATYGYGTPIQAIFQPGFAGTNVQEVRALNSGQPAPAVSQLPYAGTPLSTMGYTQAPQQAYLPSGFGAASAIFQPGFAGTDAQEVRARNTNPYLSQGYQGYSSNVNSIFSPNFANTNVQEVRALNAGQPVPAQAHHPYSQGPQMISGLQQPVGYPSPYPQYR